MAEEQFTAISVREDVRDRIRNLKRGGQSYSDLLREMADQYDPTVAMKEVDDV